MLPPDLRGEERKLSAGENQPHIDTNEACRVSYTQECCVPSRPGPQCPEVEQRGVLAVHGCPTSGC